MIDDTLKASYMAMIIAKDGLDKESAPFVLLALTNIAVSLGLQNTIINNDSIDDKIVKELGVKIVNFLLSIAEDMDDDTLIESVKKQCLSILGEDNVELKELLSRAGIKKG